MPPITSPSRASGTAIDKPVFAKIDVSTGPAVTLTGSTQDALMRGTMRVERGTIYIPDVVKTFALLRKKMKARLLMVGEGPELPGARTLAKELGVEKDVSFLGKQQAVEDGLRDESCASLAQVPSRLPEPEQRPGHA